jgi:hypothetical protein
MKLSKEMQESLLEILQACKRHSSSARHCNMPVNRTLDSDPVQSGYHIHTLFP